MPTLCNYTFLFFESKRWVKFFLSEVVLLLPQILVLEVNATIVHFLTFHLSEYYLSGVSILSALVHQIRFPQRVPLPHSNPSNCNNQFCDFHLRPRRGTINHFLFYTLLLPTPFSLLHFSLNIHQPLPLGPG